MSIHTMVSYLSNDSEVKVKFEFTEGEKAVYWPNDSAYPGSEPEVEIVSVIDKDGFELVDEIDNGEYEEMREQAFEQILFDKQEFMTW